MTSRERLLAAMEYRNPDKIPLYYHPSKAGLHLHGRKLLDLFNEYPPDNVIEFNSIPHPPEDAVDKDGEYYECYKDEWGATVEYRVFGLQGYICKAPFSTWNESRNYTFPPAPMSGTVAFENLQRKVKEHREEKLIIEGWVSLFQKLYELEHMEKVLVDLFSEDSDLMAFLDRLTDYWEQVIDSYLKADVDVIMFADDWCTQTSQLMPTDIYSRHFEHRYHRLMEPIRKSGKKIFFHVCGCRNEIFDKILDLGIHGIWPQIALLDLESFAADCKDRGILSFIHPDRQHLIPRGRPEEIERTIAKYAEHYHKLGGGAMFYVEIENDAPFENVNALIKAIDKYR
ncbi:MAG TPA: uroporphyrinogen decarboxylase family protein [archaeon]|nr:uroporphyrinogen decarboxylase family protein [archaeon]